MHHDDLEPMFKGYKKKTKTTSPSENENKAEINQAELSSSTKDNFFQPRWDNLLLNATQTGNMNDFNTAIKNNANINCSHTANGFKHYTPMHHAAENGYFNMVTILANNGANLNRVITPISDIYSNAGQYPYFTPAELADENGHTEVALFLRKKQTQKNIKTVFMGLSAFIAAVSIIKNPSIYKNIPAVIGRLFGIEQNHSRTD